MRDALRIPACMAIRKIFRWARPAVAVAVLAAMVWRLGTGPLLDGVSALDGRALAGAAVIALVTTICFAWRWKTVADGLGVRLSLADAVPAYYRSIFLNVTLPGDTRANLKMKSDWGAVYCDFAPLCSIR